MRRDMTVWLRLRRHLQLRLLVPLLSGRREPLLLGRRIGGQQQGHQPQPAGPGRQVRQGLVEQRRHRGRSDDGSEVGGEVRAAMESRTEHLIDEIVDSEPDLLAFSVLTASLPPLSCRTMPISP